MTLKRTSLSYKLFSVFTSFMLLFQYFSPVIGLMSIDNANAATAITGVNSSYLRGETVNIGTSGLTANKYYRISVTKSDSTNALTTNCTKGDQPISGTYLVLITDPLGSWSVDLNNYGSSVTCSTSPSTTSTSFSVSLPPVSITWPSLWENYLNADGRIVNDFEDGYLGLNDDSNGGSNVTPTEIDIASGAVATGTNPGDYPSLQYAYGLGTDLNSCDDDVIFLRMRLVGDPVASGGSEARYSSYHWDFLVNADSNSDIDYVIDVFGGGSNANGSYGEPGTIGLYSDPQLIAGQWVYNPATDGVWVKPVVDSANDYTRIENAVDGNNYWMEMAIPLSAFAPFQTAMCGVSNLNNKLFASTAASNTNPLQKDWMGGDSFFVETVKSKSVENITRPGATTLQNPAWPDDVIVYTLSVENTGTLSSLGFQIQDDISDILEYADVANLNYDGNAYSGTVLNGLISWPARSLLPGNVFTEKFSVTVKPYIDWPTADLILDNVYGNPVTVYLVDFGGFSGVKWNDLDGNGVKDASEPVMSGWVINIKDDSGSTIDTLTTDFNGSYAIGSLVPGTYEACEVQKNGWEITYPVNSNCQNVSVVGGQMVNDVDFGNRGDLSISGQKWEYQESYINGWEISLSGTTDYGRSVNEMMDTAGNGDYVFDHLEPGSYVVSEESRIGWVHMDLNNVPVTLIDQDEYVDFTNFECATLSGYKWEDTNGDGLLNGGEPYLEGVQIEINGPESFYDSVPTNPNGYYEFEVCIPGDYTVTEVIDPGWYNTYPMTHEHSRNVMSGDEFPNLIFGNAMYGMILGVKFGDLNGNGVLDGVEGGLGGWDVELQDGVGNVLDVTTTASDGSYSFMDLAVGQLYFLREKIEDQLGWTQTYGPSSTFTLESGDVYGDDVEEVTDFGNFELGSISGRKFLDVDADGVKDPAEIWKSGVTVELYKWSGSSYVYSTEDITDGNCYYEFTALVAGTYKVEEVITGSWLVSSPAMGINYYDGIVITSGSDVTDRDFGNYINGHLSGRKFNDLNADGSRTSDEPYMGGWEIELLDSSQNPVGSTVFTQAGDGVYDFEVTPGDYYVREINQSEWYKSAPTSDMYGPITVHAGESFLALNFGNYQLGELTVHKDVVAWDDSPINDSTVFTVNLSGEGTEPISEISSEVFGSLVPGTYTLTETIIPSGYEFVSMSVDDSGDTGYQIEITSGESEDITVVNRQLPSSIEVLKYEDKNGNGNYEEATELGVEGWSMELYQGLNCEGTVIESSTTDSNGESSFTNLPPGNYSVLEETRDGWDSKSVSCVAIVLGVNDTGSILFGNYQPGSISGMKFHDLNANSINDGEPGLENWEINLYEWDGSDYSILSDTVYTDVDGEYVFSGIAPGNYRVQEFVQSGWHVSHPNPGQDHYDNFIIHSGSNPTGADFGNYQLGELTVHKDVVAWDGSPINDSTVFTVNLSGEGTEPISEISSELFGSLVPGTYTLTETIVPPGYELVSMSVDDSGDTGYQITITSGESAEITVVNRQLPSTIDVFKYEDIDGNGIYDVGTEQGIENWRFDLYSGMDCGMNEKGSFMTTLTTDSLGMLSFTNLLPGTYSVLETLPNGWIYPGIPVDGWSSDTAVCKTVNLGVDDTKFVSFGNFELGKVSGYKFDDVNGDGVWDDGELALQGWEICLEHALRAAEVNGLHNCTLTDAFGYYEFTNLGIEDYSLSETPQDGWDQTVAPDIFEITESSQVLENQNFGNRFIISDLQIEKFDDEVEPFKPGERITYTLSVTNNGPYDAENVVVTDTLPADVTYFQSFAENGGTCSHSGGIVSCNLGKIVVGDSVNVVIEADISLLFTGELENVATVTSDTPDEDLDNNEDDEFTLVEEEGDVLGVKDEPEPEVLGATGQNIRLWVALGLLGMMMSTSVYWELKRRE